MAPADLLDCYRRGLFPMAESRDSAKLFLVDPEERGVLPLAPFRVPRRLARTVRRDPFRVTADEAFDAVIAGCAESAPGRTETWINDDIRALYGALHRQGHAHSIECWAGDALAGGLYGVALGGAFFGESMFSRATDASKIALVHLAGRLQAGGFTLLDAQFHNAHLAQFGIETISRQAFRRRLRDALARSGNFHAMAAGVSGAQLLQSMAHTS
ncbi:MAG: leucyl/phenylalanyl-tRNA--protein transferase [Hyphomonadaceae bacterium]|nr:leucyl/phenylalanyl-tRNA--protein transferase [Hyphomonadaceae bacterium]